MCRSLAISLADFNIFPQQRVIKNSTTAWFDYPSLRLATDDDVHYVETSCI